MKYRIYVPGKVERQQWWGDVQQHGQGSRRSEGMQEHGGMQGTERGRRRYGPVRHRGAWWGACSTSDQVRVLHIDLSTT